jgi:hypothetical protein
MMATYKSKEFCLIIQLQNASKPHGMRQHVANAWKKRLPSIIKYYFRRITGINIE